MALASAAGWMAATGIVPKRIEQTAGKRPATIQDKWFARLFPIKALMIALQYRHKAAEGQLEMREPKL